MPARLQFLSGWKQIANYLGMGVRTLQRYERERGLPIHRPAGKSAGSVVATKAELESWVTAGAVRVKRWPTERTNTIGAEFLQIDSEIAWRFAASPWRRPIREREAAPLRPHAKHKTRSCD